MAARRNTVTRAHHLVSIQTPFCRSSNLSIRLALWPILHVHTLAWSIMAPTKPRVSDPGAKKRRTFFSSNLPFLPKIAGTSRPATTPSDKVLAALLPPVSRDPSPERQSRARKQVRKDEELHQAASLDMVPPADLPKQPTPPRITRPIRTSASSKSLVVEPKASSVPWRKPSAVITNRRASAPVRTTKAQTAQSTNSKLSAALEMAMRSTISGRATPYMRDNTWNVMTVTSAKARGKIKEKEGAPGRKKEYMSAGFYCQDADAVSPHKLVSKVLRRQKVLQKVQGKGKGKGKEVVRPKHAAAQATTGSDHDLSFPPLPYDHGHDHFFGQEHEFVLPYNIQWEAENGSLDGKKKPTPFQKIRGSTLYTYTFDLYSRIRCLS